MQGNLAETTLLFEHSAGTATLWTTRRSVFQGTIRRNPKFIAARELHPGYEIVFPIEELRTPAQCIRHQAGGSEVEAGFLTESEKASRVERSERAKSNPGFGSPTRRQLELPIVVQA